MGSFNSVPDPPKVARIQPPPTPTPVDGNANLTLDLEKVGDMVLHSYAGDERYALNITSNRALVGELLECGIISKGVNPEAAALSLGVLSSVVNEELNATLRSLGAVHSLCAAISAAIIDGPPETRLYRSSIIFYAIALLKSIWDLPEVAQALSKMKFWEMLSEALHALNWNATQLNCFADMLCRCTRLPGFKWSAVRVMMFANSVIIRGLPSYSPWAMNLFDILIPHYQGPLDGFAPSICHWLAKSTRVQELKSVCAFLHKVLSAGPKLTQRSQLALLDALIDLLMRYDLSMRKIVVDPTLHLIRNCGPSIKLFLPMVTEYMLIEDDPSIFRQICLALAECSPAPASSSASTSLSFPTPSAKPPQKSTLKKSGAFST